MSRSSRQKQRIWLIIAFIIIGYGASQFSAEQAYSPIQVTKIEHAFQQQQSNVQLQVTGKVITLLKDDLDGNRHQRFIIKLAHDQTLLIAHNIDLANRIDQLKIDDEITLFGEYEWNAKGGVLHWTHHDPAKRHIDGWIKHQDKTYQ